MYISRKGFDKARASMRDSRTRKFHVDPANGKVGECNANIQCPITKDFPSESQYLHYSTRAEAEVALEALNSARAVFKKLDENSLVKSREWSSATNRFTNPATEIPSPVAVDELPDAIAKNASKGFLGEFYTREYGVQPKDLLHIKESSFMTEAEEIVYKRELDGIKKELSERDTQYSLYPAPHSMRELIKRLSSRIEDEKLRREIQEAFKDSATQANVLYYLGISSKERQDIAKGISSMIIEIDRAKAKVLSSIKNETGSTNSQIEDYARIRNEIEPILEEYISKEKAFWTEYLTKK